MKVDGVVTSCYRGDYWLAKIAVASVRYWYPDISIYLITDNAKGEVDASELVEAWGVQVLELEHKTFGNAISKMETFFIKPQQRLLFIDSDIVLIGRLLERLEQSDEDFVISPNYLDDPYDVHVSSYYFDFDDIKAHDPEFEYPGYVFNAGQLLVSSDVLKRSDFTDYFHWKSDGAIKAHPSIFRGGDQGTLNYLFPKFEQLKKISLGLVDFKIFAHPDNVSLVDFEKVPAGEGMPKLIHWAGRKYPLPRMYVMSEFLCFFEDYYYSRVPNGVVKRKGRALCRLSSWLLARLLKKIKRAGGLFLKRLGLR